MHANGSDAEALYLLAAIKQAAGDLAAAEVLFRKAVALDPKNARYHTGLAEVTGQMAQRASIESPGLPRTPV